MEERVDHTLPSEIWPNLRERVEYAFTIKGVDYYCFSDFLSTPADRAFWSLTYFQENELRCDREYLLKVCDKIDAVVNAKEIRLTEVVKVSAQLRERLQYAFFPKLLYKLCSVMFFDRTENPLRHDQTYAEKKADIFRQAPISDFFFAVPVKKLVPLGTLSRDDLPSYLAVADKADNEMLSRLLQT